MRRLRVRKLAAAAFVCLLFAASAHAAMYDLTDVNSWAVINGAIFNQYTPGPTGTGNIDSFVRLQGPQASDIQQGYNSDGRPVQYDEDIGSQRNHSILLRDIPRVTNGGGDYLEFLLDINQDVDTILSLDKIEVYLETTGNLLGHPGNFSSAVYDLDDGADNWIKLDDSINGPGGGSGAGDMLLYILESAFTGAENYDGGGDNYIYLYSRLGDNFSASDGFEEWAYGVDGPIIPEPATVLLLGLGALALLRRRRGAVT